jgi:hypothetical protein
MTLPQCANLPKARNPQPRRYRTAYALRDVSDNSWIILVRPRTHAITFRLGEEEYQDLVGAVAKCGARSISDFSRAAVLNKISTEQLSRFFEEDADALAGRLESFDSKLREIRRRVRQLVSSTVPSGQGKSISD